MSGNPISVSMLVYGDAGVGKTWLGMTTPEPRLILDVEGRTRFALARTEWEEWDGQSPPPEEARVPTTVVKVRGAEALSSIYRYLASGKHPWNSVVLDSLTEYQKRVIDSLVGPAQMQLQDWGTLLRKLESTVRAFRDLTEHPTKPLYMVLLIAMAAYPEGAPSRPLLQGQLATTIPYYTDVTAKLIVEAETGTRVLLTQPLGSWVAKDATGMLPPSIANPNLTQIWEEINK